MKDMNIDVITEEDQKQLSDLITELKPEVDTKTELQSDDWLCLICNKKITTDKARFLYNDQSEFQFINPDGFVFDIITFNSADGCLDAGVPTIKFTWFPGHFWSYAMCSRCGSHLGWKYSGKFSFYGLIKERIIKGVALFN